jgi:hypothetical protein
VTTRARLVLADCEAALDDLAVFDQSALRRRWVAVVALLRAVGHVLDKVDGARSRPIRTVVDQKFRELKMTKPEPAVFWSFIEDERNSVLKTYEFGVRSEITIAVGRAAFRVDEQGGKAVEVPFTPTRVEFLLQDGPFAGQNPVAVVRQAIQFWGDYLDDVDRRVGESNGL